MIGERHEVPVALAGSDDDSKVVPASVKLINLQYVKFEDKHGKPLNPDDYNPYVVSGRSMQFCGILDNDLIFTTKKIDDIARLEFPSVLVLEKTGVGQDGPRFKIRRSWMLTDYSDNLLDTVKELLAEDKFQEIRRLSQYDGDEALLKDFEETRLRRYKDSYIDVKAPNPRDRKIIVSTTYHTKEGKIRFSIHPVDTIRGKVIASFHDLVSRPFACT